jgi:long-chain acyl-CoA synthetase
MALTSYGKATFHYARPDNLVDLFEESAARNRDRLAFGTRDAAGEYQWVTYGQVAERIDAVRAGLASLGVQPGDAVGLIANNRVEWAIAAFATYGLRARFVPMYEAELPHVWKYVLGDAGVRVLFVSKPEILDQVKAFQAELPRLGHFVLIDGSGPGSLEAVEAAGRAAPVPSQKPAPQETACLIYTSGTTGDPKGVLLSHGNFTSNVHAGVKLMCQLDHTTVGLSILPWAHSYGQTAELYCGMHLGGATGFIGSPQTILEDIGKVRPTFLISVPRIFNRIHAGIRAKVDQEGGLKKVLFEAAMKVARQRRLMAARGERSLPIELAFKVLDKVVLSKVRARFGGRLASSMSGSAAMNPEIAGFFADLGIYVYDCYGLTETTPAVTMNAPVGFKFGSVGRPIDQCRVVIDTTLGDPALGDGEIIVYGPNVMQGYHNKPEATAAVMTADGGFRTGDRGRLDDDGYLWITGRIKEQYKLENGKYVFPAAIEEELKLLPIVANVMIHGEGKLFNVALVVPNLEALARDEKGKDLPHDLAALAGSPEAAAFFLDAFKAHLKGRFGGYEIPGKVLLVDEDFTLQNGMLTQTLKLKRREVLKRYGEAIEGLYRK